MNRLLGAYEKSMPNALTIPEKLRLVKSCGFDFMEISIDESEEKLSRLAYSEREMRALRAAQEEAGLRILTMCLSGHRRFPLGSRDESVRERGMEILHRAVDFAVAVGIRVIQLAGYDVYYEEHGEDTAAFFLENLAAGVRYAASRGVVLAFETMETPFMNTVEKAMRYVNEVGSPYLQVYPDIGNVTNGAKDALKDLAAGKSHIAAAHLKETKPGVYRDVPFGTGRVDFAGCIETLQRLGVGLFVGEFWYDGVSDAGAYLASARAFLERQFCPVR